MRIEIPLVGGQYISRSTAVDAQKCINLYPVFDRSGGKPLSLQPVPGLKTWIDTTIQKPVRAMYKFNSKTMYCVIGETIYKVDYLLNYTALSCQHLHH